MIKRKLLSFYVLIKTTFFEFFEENSFFHGAALAYYTMVALIPILYLGIEIFGSVVGQETMVKIITNVLQKNIGIEDMSGISVFLKQIDFTKGSFVLRITGIIFLIISSTALLMSLRQSINDFFDIQLEKRTKGKIIKESVVTRLISLGILCIMGLMLIATYFGQTILISAGRYLFNEQDGFQWFLSILIQHGLSILSNLVMFTFVFKYLHDGQVSWKIAWSGAILTSVLLYVGQILIKYYLINLFFAKDGGVAGTMFIVLAWMYYTSQIIFIGAKFTAVYAIHKGQRIIPKK